MRKRTVTRTRITGITAAAVVAILAWSVWPRGTGLVPYITPPLTLGTETVQLHAQIPAGWEVHAAQTNSMFFSGVGGTQKSVPISVSISITPVVRAAWMPHWIRQRLFGATEKSAEVYLAYSDWESVGGEKVYTFVDHIDGMARYHARRDLGPGLGFIVYQRTNRAEFDATYKDVCASLKVVR